MIIVKDYAGSQQLVFLSPVPDWDLIGSAPVRMWQDSTRSDRIRSVYSFNIWDKYNDYPEITGEWTPIWVISYQDKLGDNIYSNLETGFPITKLAQFNTNEQKYTVNFKFFPLIPHSPAAPTDINYSGGSAYPYSVKPVSWDSEKHIYDMAVNIAYPTLVQTTIPDSSFVQKLGPVFPTQISFGMTAGQNVDVSVVLDGAKYFVPDVDLNNFVTSDTENVYRGANFIDCYCDFVGLTSLFSPRNTRIIEMALSITQKFNYQFTCAQGVDTHGPTFVELADRTVSGNIRFFSKDQITDPVLSKELIMYFGGPFYFHMRNIRWQNPTVDISPEQGYVHTYNFIALADTKAIISADPKISKPTCSEFYFG